MAAESYPSAQRNSSKSSECMVIWVSYPTGTDSGISTASSSSSPYVKPSREPEEMTSKRKSMARYFTALLALPQHWISSRKISVLPGISSKSLTYAVILLRISSDVSSPSKTPFMFGWRKKSILRKEAYSFLPNSSTMNDLPTCRAPFSRRHFLICSVWRCSFHWRSSR